MLAMIHLFQFVLVCGLFLWPPVHAEEQWQEKINRQGIQVFQQHLHPKFKHMHTKGVLKVRAKPEAVVALMQDFKVCQQWVFGCLAAEFLPNHKGSGRFVHMMFKGPLWLKDRDVVVQVEVEHLENNQWQISIKNKPELYPNKKYVRIQQTEATWLLTPLDKGRLEVSYSVYLDPKINFKAGVNKYNRDAVFSTLQNMRRMLRQASKNQAGQ